MSSLSLKKELLSLSQKKKEDERSSSYECGKNSTISIEARRRGN